MVPIHVEIWVCAKLLSKEKEVFTKQELTRLIEKEFGDTRHGISTHISSVCVANKISNHPHNYNYLVSVNRGEYRVFGAGDIPDPSKIRASAHPDEENIPERFRYLIDAQTVPTPRESKAISLSTEPAPAIKMAEELWVNKREPINGKALIENEEEAVGRTILMMAYNPSCARIFAKQTNTAIKNVIYALLGELPDIKDQEHFNRVHKKAIENIVLDIRNSKRNGSVRGITYGQAQKGLNVFLKVYVDWSNLPNADIAETIRPYLHCPLDSIVMKEIRAREKTFYQKNNRPPCSLRAISTYEQYLDWQKIIDEIVKREQLDKRTIVDVIWYQESQKKKEDLYE